MRSGDVYLFNADGDFSEKYQRKSLGSDTLFDEKWLQKIIFENIDLITVTDPSYDKISVIPLCRELTLNDGIRNIFLDILAVTETGKLILIECKLWKNPQARREVLAQTLEYASLLQSLSYSDLTAKLKKHLPALNQDPIAELFRSEGIEFDEGLLIDRISDCLKKGDFHLIIAGDGIRADLVNLVSSRVMSGMTAHLSLLEISVHQSSNGEILLLPAVPSETETVTRTVLLSAEGMPALIEEELTGDIETSIDKNGVAQPMKKETKEANTLFWNKVISEVRFDHPDQDPLRRGGSNWCKAILPDPLRWLTAYRSKDRIGVFLKIDDENVSGFYEFFSDRLSQMEKEISSEISCQISDNVDKWANGSLFIGVTKLNVDTTDPSTVAFQIEWLSEHLNKFVNFLRPIIHQLPD